MGWLVGLVSLWIGAGASPAASADKVVLSPGPGLDRADVYFAPLSGKPAACVVLCPGFNGNGASLLDRREWREFAQKNNLALAAISFASDPNLLLDGKGYYDAAAGSGNALLKAVDSRFGEGTRLLLYGFSGGAHFVSSFEEWKPERVIAWCADSAAWWADPKATHESPPGIIACGELDGERYGASLLYFQRGRKLGKPWCWVSVANLGHAESQGLQDLVRLYFAGVLNNRSNQGHWVDLDSKEAISPHDRLLSPELSCWMPNAETKAAWERVHHP